MSAFFGHHATYVTLPGLYWVPLMLFTLVKIAINHLNCVMASL